MVINQRATNKVLRSLTKKSHVGKNDFILPNLSGVQLPAKKTPSPYIFPIVDGAASEFLQTDGSGVLSWAAAGANPAGADTQIQFNNSGAFGASANMTWDGTSIEVAGGSPYRWAASGGYIAPTATQTTIYGGNTTGDDLTIRANDVNTYPAIRLDGNDDVNIIFPSGKALNLIEGAASKWEFYDDYLTFKNSGGRLTNTTTSTTITGGNAASDDLILSSTSHGTKGTVQLVSADGEVDLSGTTRTAGDPATDGYFLIKISGTSYKVPILAV